MTIKAKYEVYGGAIYLVLTDPRFRGGLQTIDDRTFRVGERTLYLKYASEPAGGGAYQFTFTREEVDELYRLQVGHPDLHLGLICRQDGEVCCLNFQEFEEKYWERQQAAKDVENNFWLKVALQEGCRFRVSADHPGRRGVPLGDPLVVPRSAFPARLFDAGGQAA